MGGVSNKSDNPGDKTTYNPTTGKTSEPKTGGLKKFVEGGGFLGHIFSETIGKAAAKSNLKRRQKFISKYNANVPPSEKINLTDEQILSKDGLSSLKGKGYTTISDRLVTGEKGNNNNQSDAKPILEIGKFPTGEGVTTPFNATDAEVSQAQSTTMSADEILVANKKKGRKQTILNNSEGLGGSTANTMKKTLGA